MVMIFFGGGGNKINLCIYIYFATIDCEKILDTTFVCIIYGFNVGFGWQGLNSFLNERGGGEKNTVDVQIL